MNPYQISFQIFKKKLNENSNMTEKQWNQFAHENNLFSSFTLQAHQDVLDWDSLKQSVKKPNNKIAKEIEKLKKRLYKEMNKHGLTSPQVLQINHEIHTLWQEDRENLNHQTERIYPSQSTIYLAFQKSYQKLKELTNLENHFPSRKEWNQYAQNNQLLCNQSIEFIAQKNWNQLRKTILKENYQNQIIGQTKSTR